MNGIIIVDKPAGWTSHDVVAKLRGALRKDGMGGATGAVVGGAMGAVVGGATGGSKNVKRVGHGGTLDPMATGVLPVFIGRATRAAEFCENSEKEYIAGLRLGLVTDTQDITGKIISVCGADGADDGTDCGSNCGERGRAYDGADGSAYDSSNCGASGISVSPDDVLSVLPRFLGAQKQTPPMYSAIKIDGKKLYESARRGLDVPRPARDVFISEIELLGGAGNEYTLKVACSKGTYVRTLCHDIGAALGCGGAMSSLRRVKAGAFTLDMARRLDEILDAAAAGAIEKFLLPVDTIFSKYPAAPLSGRNALKCRNGAPCHVDDMESGIYRFYGPDNEFLLLGEIKSGEIKVIKSFFEPT